MNTAQEFRDYMQPFVNSDLKPTAKDLDIQVYSRDRLTVTIGYRSMIPSIMFVADDKKSGFLIYIATVNDTNGPNQHRVVFTWKWADSLDILLKNCTACNNIQLIVESLRGLTAEESTKGMYCPNCGKELSEGSKFCSKCGKPTLPTLPENPVKPASTVTLNSKTLLVIAGVVIAALLAVLILRPGLDKAPDTPPSANLTSPVQQQEAEPTLTPEPTPEPTPEVDDTYGALNGYSCTSTGIPRGAVEGWNQDGNKYIHPDYPNVHVAPDTRVYRNVGYYVVVDDGSPMDFPYTIRGLRLGDPEDKIYDAFPGIILKDNENSANSKVADYGDISLGFWFTNGQIRSIHVTDIAAFNSAVSVFKG